MGRAKFAKATTAAFQTLLNNGTVDDETVYFVSEHGDFDPSSMTADSEGEIWLGGTKIGSTDGVIMPEISYDDNATSDLQALSKIGGYISTVSGDNYLKWKSTPSTGHKMFPLPPNSVRVRITANNSQAAKIAFLTANDSLSGVTDGQIPSFVTGTGIIEISAGQTADLAVPSTAKYIYVYVGNLSSTPNEPSAIVLTLLRSASADTTGLALDSAVVHNTGNETVGGDKTYTGEATFNDTINLPKTSPNDEDITISNGTMTASDHTGVLSLGSESGEVTVRGVAEPVGVKDAANKEYVDGKAGNSKVFYGMCRTAADTATKDVTCSDFTSSELTAGVMVIVSFANGNSAGPSGLKLNVNGTGAKLIKRYNNNALTDLSSASQIRPAALPFIYTSGYWVAIGLSWNTTYSQLTQSEVSAGTNTGARVVDAKMLRNNFVFKSDANVIESILLEDGNQDQHPVAIGLESCYNDGTNDVARLALEDNSGGSQAVSEVILGGIHTPVNQTDAANKSYVDTKDSNVVHKTGDETIAGDKTFTGEMALDSSSSNKHRITLNTAIKTSSNIGVLEIADDDQQSGAVLRGVAYPVNDNDAASKKYADERGMGVTQYSGTAGFNGLHSNSLCALDYENKMSSFTTTGGNGTKTVDTSFYHYFHLPIPKIMCFRGTAVNAGGTYTIENFSRSCIVDVRYISLRGSQLPTTWANLGDPVYLSFTMLASPFGMPNPAVRIVEMPCETADTNDLYTFPNVPRDIIISKKMMDEHMAEIVDASDPSDIRYGDAYKTFFTSTSQFPNNSIRNTCGYIYLGRMVSNYDLMLEDNNPMYSYDGGYFIDFMYYMTSWEVKRYKEDIEALINQYHPQSS